MLAAIFGPVSSVCRRSRVDHREAVIWIRERSRTIQASPLVSWIPASLHVDACFWQSSEDLLFSSSASSRWILPAHHVKLSLEWQAFGAETWMRTLLRKAVMVANEEFLEHKVGLHGVPSVRLNGV